MTSFRPHAFFAAVLLLTVIPGCSYAQPDDTGSGKSKSPLVAVWSGGLESDGATIVGLLDASGVKVRAIVSNRPNFAGQKVYSEAAESVMEQGNAVRLRVSGLRPNTEYFYALELEGTLRTAPHEVGRLRTLPSPGRPAHFRFAFSSCGDWERTDDQFTYDTVRAVERDALFFLHMGDLNYRNTNAEDPERYRENYRNALTLSPPQGALFRALPIVYTWDDHDFSGNDSNRTSRGRTAHRQAYREMVPHYPLPAGGPDEAIYHAFTVGRVRFIITDLRSERDPRSAPDNAWKSMMGPEQKAWFKRELKAARDAGAPLIVWNSSVPFVTTDHRGDGWGSYQQERMELLKFIRDEGINSLIIVSGDMHGLAFDDGRATESYLPGVRIPVFQAAALARGGSVKGGPYSGGFIKGSRQYATMEIEDDGKSVRVTYTGKIAKSPTEAEVWQTHTFTAGSSRR